MIVIGDRDAIAEAKRQAGLAVASADHERAAEAAEVDGDEHGDEIESDEIGSGTGESAGTDGAALED